MTQAQTDLATLNTALATAASQLATALSAGETAEQQVAAGTPSEWATIASLFAIANAQKAVTAAQASASVLAQDLAPPPPPPPPTSASVLQGAYCGAGAVSAVKTFGTSINKTMQLVSTYCDGTSWTSISQGDWQLSAYKNCGLRLVIGVNVYCGNGNQKTDLAAGATGAHNATYTALAQNLIANGQGNAILRIGWEPDVNIFSNDDLVSAANYAKFFQQIRTTMMAVPGAAFVFSWYYGSSYDTNTINTSYPGDAYADCIELDPYDQSWYVGTGSPPYNGTNFTATQSQVVWTNDIGKRLASQAAFAKAHNKPLAFGEWGVINRSDGHGGCDDPTFIANMVNWIESNNFMWISYFNANSGGNSILADYPNSQAALKASNL